MSLLAHSVPQGDHRGPQAQGEGKRLPGGRSVRERADAVVSPTKHQRPLSVKGWLRDFSDPCDSDARVSRQWRKYLAAETYFKGEETSTQKKILKITRKMR